MYVLFKCWITVTAVTWNSQINILSQTLQDDTCIWDFFFSQVKFDENIEIYSEFYDWNGSYIAINL